jgi:hypothetical protein
MTPPSNQHPDYGPPSGPPSSPPGGYGASPYSTQPPKKKRPLLWILLGVGGLLAVCCIGGVVIVATAGDDNSPTGGSATATTSAGATAETTKTTPANEAAMGSPVRDGKFEFVVQQVECGKAQVGTEPLVQKAQGQFCLVTMSIKNISDAPQTFSDSSQKAFNASGAEYKPDSGASLYANRDQQVWLNAINPGNTLTGTVVFDIAKDAAIVRLELHDSPFSGGVKVKVG